MKFFKYMLINGIGILIGSGVLLVFGMKLIDVLTIIPIAVGYFILIYVLARKIENEYGVNVAVRKL